MQVCGIDWFVSGGTKTYDISEADFSQDEGGEVIEQLYVCIPDYL